MRIISCASYYGTGSSAITDLISEYEGVFSLTNYEFRFVQDPDGISDLEYDLVENHNRHNSGHAIKRFKRLVDFYAGNRLIKKYEPYFQYQWKNISYDYIDKLTECRYKGWWQYDLLDRGFFFYYRKLLLNKMCKMTIWRNKEDKQLNVLPNEITYCGKPSKEEFLNYTRWYLEALFEKANVDGSPNLMVDQIVPPTNLKRYLRYFNDIQVIIVDRDPRDIYLSEKLIWKGHVIPTESAELFCQWFRYTRAHRETESVNTDRVMFIQFEDLIYKYEETVSRIEKFLGFKEIEHINKKKYLNPAISIYNTRLWEKHPKYSKDIAYIEKELKDYLYRG